MDAATISELLSSKPSSQHQTVGLATVPHEKAPGGEIQLPGCIDIRPATRNRTLKSIPPPLSARQHTSGYVKNDKDRRPPNALVDPKAQAFPCRIYKSL